MEKKTNRNFWIVFSVLLLLAAISTIGNMMDYQKMDRLETQGKRIFAKIDSIAPKSGKQEVFVRFQVNGQEYKATKKVKAKVAVGDSVPVYFLPDDPRTNGVALE